MPLARALVVLLLLAIAAGCATTPPASVGQEAVATDGATAALTWKRVRFFVHWREEREEPSWSVDVLLAQRVVEPVLERYRGSITLWRFHRRAARDAAGHSLSFLVYAPESVGSALCRTLRGDTTVRRLLVAGVLDEVRCQAPDAAKARLVEATSDPSWSPALQRTWPYYIMGVSEMWLRLIDEYSQPESGFQPIGQMLAHYEAVQQKLTETWKDEGGHAFLHHLSALFAYQPVDVVQRRTYQF